jgi:hypothetical protein
MQQMLGREIIPILLCFLAISSLQGDQPATAFRAQMLTLDGNEGITTGDVDGDGQLDIVAGRNWYRGGQWTPRPLRTIEDWNGYVQSNGDYLWDVNGDGQLDVIAGSFIPSEVYWYQNPGSEALRLGKMWSKHLLVDTEMSQNEGQLMHDIDADGRPEWVVNSWQGDVPMVVWRLVDCEPSDSGARVKMVPHRLGDKGNGHGLAIGDINADGRSDVLVGQGWYEQPASDPWNGPWRFHRDWDLHASVPMIVTDLDGDGDGDLILGNGHDYGLFWWQNDGAGDDGKIAWTQHEIDRSFSQPHTLAWRDVDNDGQAELITGKRYYAHNGNDPGGNEMPCLYYYDWNQDTKAFTRQTIDEGHVGCGLQIATDDLNGDGKTDIAVAGKSGTYVLFAE